MLLQHEDCDMKKDQVIAKCRADIAAYGWHCLSVHPCAGEEGAPYTYTVGLTESFQHPELMLFGLGSGISHQILSDCVRLIREGRRFVAEVAYTDVIGGGYSVICKPLRAECMPEYCGVALRHYADQPCSALVLFWPDKNHQFPWQESVSTAQREALQAV